MLKQLKYFISVVRNNSFSAAAEENFISQSAISQQIKALERDLGLLADYERICRETSKPSAPSELRSAAASVISVCIDRPSTFRL